MTIQTPQPGNMVRLPAKYAGATRVYAYILHVSACGRYASVKRYDNGKVEAYPVAALDVLPDRARF